MAFRFGCFVLLVFVTVGCSSQQTRYGGLPPGSSKPFEVTVVLDDNSWSRAYGQLLPLLEVDLVGINESEKRTWKNYPVSRYFSPNDALRRGADRITLTFASEDRQSKSLNRHDPVWEVWIGRMFDNRTPGKDARWLFVIANIPGDAEDLPGDQDPRRLILPLKDTSWPWGTKQIEIVLKSSMAVCKTQQK